LTHEHGDHAGGLSVLVERMPRAVVYISTATHAAAKAAKEGPLKRLGEALRRSRRVETFDAGQVIRHEELDVLPFPVSHDAVDPVGFRVETEGVAVTVATDLGKITPPVASAIERSTALVLESNHDLDLLRNNEQYPRFVKERIEGSLGHLSNTQVGQFLAEGYDLDSLYLVLAHISQQNNSQQLPALLARKELAARRANWVKVLTSSQSDPTPVLEV